MYKFGPHPLMTLTAVSAVIQPSGMFVFVFSYSIDVCY
jgi:hypothetical protein